MGKTTVNLIKLPYVGYVHIIYREKTNYIYSPRPAKVLTLNGLAVTFSVLFQIIIGVIAVKIIITTAQQRAPMHNPPPSPFSTSIPDGNALVFAWNSPKMIVGIKRMMQHIKPKTITALNPIVSPARVPVMPKTPPKNRASKKNSDNYQKI
jgi:hypothetical protein